MKANSYRKNILRRVFGRLLHLLARFSPGATTFRPFLHRLRGVRIGKNVFIGDDVYLENEYPERVEIQDGAQISVRATILAHTVGPGYIIIEREAAIGAHAVIATSGGRTIRIGAGSVVGIGCVVTRDVKPRTFVTGEFGRAVAEVRVPLPRVKHLQEFTRGLVPLKPKAGKNP